MYVGFRFFEIVIDLHTYLHKYQHLKDLSRHLLMV